MTESDKGSDVPVMAAMFAVILITRLTIAFATDWPSAVGGVAEERNTAGLGAPSARPA